MIISQPEQRECSIGGQTVSIIRASDGQLYVSISQICRSFLLDPGAQTRRIKRHASLQMGLRVLTIQTPGGEQRTNCLRIDQISPWLDGIDRNLAEPVRALLAEYQQNLADLARRIFFGEETLLQESEEGPRTTTALVSSPLPGAVVESTPLAQNVRDLPNQRQLALLASGETDAPTRLLVTSYGEDTAFRESCLADFADWLHPELPDDPFFFTSSNRLRVYLSPNEPLDLPQAIEQIKKIGVRTVLLARLTLALWNSQRYSGQLADNGSIAIPVNYLLEWLQPNGSEKKYQLQLYREFFYLQNCHLVGDYSYRDAQGKFHQLSVDSPYMRVSPVRETNLWGEKEIIGFLVAPGDWITTHARASVGYFGLLDRKIFSLNPQNDQIPLKIGLLLIERWSHQTQCAQQAPSLSLYEQPITTEQLLTASMIPFDRHTFPLRFTERIEAAFQTLLTQKILSEAPVTARKGPAHKHWREEWLSAEWVLRPHLDAVEGPLLLPTRTTAPRTHRKKG